MEPNESRGGYIGLLEHTRAHVDNTDAGTYVEHVMNVWDVV